jgi:tRNA dimethylallyltransferase
MKVAMGITNPQKKPSVALIAGPTASGKTGLALYLAQQKNVVIINADSAQVYADLPILSAQPTPSEMASAPHKLFGYLQGGAPCSAAKWAADAAQEIAAAHDAGALPILVGGTGLYLRTLLQGIAPMPPVDAGIRAEARALPTPEAWAALCAEDVAAADALHPNDDVRVKRALEVVRSTGISVTHWRTEKTGGIEGKFTVQSVLLLPPRDWLYTRCDARFVDMMDAGAVDEVRILMERGLPKDAPVMRAIGVPEIRAMLNGEIGRDEAIRLGRIATRQYAKRQYTWFRNQSPVNWPRWEEEINDSNLHKIVTLFQKL